MDSHDCHESERCCYIIEYSFGEMCHMKCKRCGRKWIEDLVMDYGCHEVLWDIMWEQRYP